MAAPDLQGRATPGCHCAGARLSRAAPQVFKHHHEEATGRTSSIGQHNLCLDSHGAILNDGMFRSQTCSDYISRASKVVTLVDLAGHEKYFRQAAAACLRRLALRRRHSCCWCERAPAGPLWPLPCCVLMPAATCRCPGRPRTA
jgi:hypothetical protein